MKITATSVSDAASNPAHPDHDAWVKDRTLRMEIEHAKRLGVPLRVAEQENQRLLERTAIIARESKPAAKGADTTARTTREQRMRARGITRRKPKKHVPARKLSPCGRCGVCRACMRERRVLKIIEKHRTGDQVMTSLILELTATLMNAMRGIGKFKELTPRDSDRLVERETESVCDRSIRWLGEWR